MKFIIEHTDKSTTFIEADGIENVEGNVVKFFRNEYRSGFLYPFEVTSALYVMREGELLQRNSHD